MRIRVLCAFALAVSALALLACPNVIDPGPGPDPGPGGGFDCGSSATPSGVVPVADPIPGRYIVVFKDPQPGVRAAGVEATAQSLLQKHKLSQLVVFDAAIAGFSCSTAAEEEAEHMAADPPTVAFVQQDGRKQVSPIPAQEGATWGLDRTDQRDLPPRRPLRPRGGRPRRARLRHRHRHGHQPRRVPEPPGRGLLGPTGNSTDRQQRPRHARGGDRRWEASSASRRR